MPKRSYAAQPLLLLLLAQGNLLPSHLLFVEDI
jgi:hypothetical protein